MSAILDRSLALLEHLAKAPDGISLTELSTDSGVASGTAHRLLAHLIKRGYVRQSERGMYSLTLQLPLLAAHFLHGKGFLNVCQPRLDELAHHSGELVRLAWLDGDRLVFIAEAQSARRGLRYDANLGQIAILHATAIGKTWLAAQSDKDALRRVRAQGRIWDPNLGPRAIQSEKELLTEIERVREQGYAIAIDEGEIGAAAVSVPILAEDHVPAYLGGIAIIGPTARLSRPKLEAFVPHLRKAAASIVEMLPLRTFCKDRGAVVGELHRKSIADTGSPPAGTPPRGA